MYAAIAMKPTQCVSTANPPNSAQLLGTSYYSSKLHQGMCSSVGMWRGTDTHTHTDVTNIHFTWLCLMQNVNSYLKC